ncbi:MAG: hypothetical protein ACE5GQ_03730 [Nitrospinales bacterium]
MSSRYYWISTIIVAVLTAVISLIAHKRSAKDVFFVFCGVAGGVVLLVSVLIGFARLLEFLGIAERGFAF